MRGMAWVTFIGCGLLNCAAAAGELPASAIDTGKKLLGQRRAIYLARQLELSESQTTQVQGLIDAILPENEPLELDPDRVRAIWKEIEAAKQAGDNAKIDKLTQELQRMNKESTDESDFLQNFKALLTDEQKTRVEAALERLGRNPSGALRPIDLVRCVMAMNLDDAQRAKVRTAGKEMRKILYPDLSPTPEKCGQLINFLHEEFHKILTPEQYSAYETEVERMRPDRIEEGILVKKP